MKEKGIIVKLLDGRIGRTFNNKGLINGKVPIYLLVDYPSVYSEKAILIEFNKIEKTIGFID